MELSIFAMLCNHHSCSFPKTFHHPRQNSVPFSKYFSFCISPQHLVDSNLFSISMCFISLDISYRCIQYHSFSVWFISLYLTFSGLIHISGHVSEFHTLSWLINVPLYAYIDFVLYLNEIILIFSFVSGSFVQYYI